MVCGLFLVDKWHVCVTWKYSSGYWFSGLGFTLN